MRPVNKTIKVLLFFLFSVNTASALWNPLFSVFITKNIIGGTLAIVGLSAALYSITKSFLQIVVAKRLDARKGERDEFKSLVFGIALACLCSFSFLFIDKIWQLSLVQILWGVADAFTMAAYYALFSHHVDRKSASFEWSLFSVGGITSAAAVGGLIGGLAAETYGFSMVFITAGMINLLSFVLLMMLRPQLKYVNEA